MMRCSITTVIKYSQDNIVFEMYLQLKTIFEWYFSFRKSHYKILPIHLRNVEYQMNEIFIILFLIAGSFKSQLIDYFEGHIVSWESFGRFILIRTK